MQTYVVSRHGIADGAAALAAALTRLRAFEGQAVRHWREVGSTVGEAETHMRLAECLLQGQDATGSELELHAVESHLATVAVAHRECLHTLRDALTGLRGTASGLHRGRRVHRPPLVGADTERPSQSVHYGKRW